MRLWIFTATLLASLTSFAQFTDLNTGINDNLNDVYFSYPRGIAVGDKGIYLTSNGGIGPGSWNRFTPTDPTTLALYNRCKFYSVRAGSLSFQTLVCGYDTVNTQAIVFTVHIINLTYSLVYTGPANSILYNLKFLNGSTAYAVGTNGLMVRLGTSSTTATVIPSVTNKTLRALAFSGIGTDTICAVGDSVFVKSYRIGTTNFSTAYPQNRKYSGVFSDLANFYFLSSDGMFKSTTFGPGAPDLDTLYHGSPLPCRWAAQESATDQTYVMTDQGLYRKFQSVFEQIPTNLAPVITNLFLPPFSSNGYVCGKNGLVAAFANYGGESIPYFKAFLNSGCRTDPISITRMYAGSANSCQLRAFDQSGNPVGSVMNTNCSGSWNTNWNVAGNFNFQYIESNGLYADTTYFARSFTDAPVGTSVFQSNDTLFCKSGIANLSVTATLAGWDYILQKKNGQPASNFVSGNGGQLIFTSNTIAASDTFRMIVKIQNGDCARPVTGILKVKVEHPKGMIRSMMINAPVQTNVNMIGYGDEVSNFSWGFDNSASSSTLTGKNVVNSFNSSGQKQVQLISWTNNNCYDTSNYHVVTVVDESTVTDDCYSLVEHGIEPQWNGIEYTPRFRDMTLVKDGIMMAGGDRQYSLPSRLGDTLQKTTYGGSFLAKYSRKGTLLWRIYSKFPNYDCGYCNNIQYRPGVYKSFTNDITGRTTFAGMDYPESWIYFNNGDSIQPVGPQIYQANYNSFIITVDSLGRHLWNTFFRQGVIQKFKKDQAGNFLVILRKTYGTYCQYVNGQSITVLHDSQVDPNTSHLLVRLDANGNYISHIAANVSNLSDAIEDVNGDLWLAGNYVNATLYNPNYTVATTLAPVDNGTSGAFIAKYAGNAMFKSAMRVRSDYWPQELRTDSSGFVYVEGRAGSYSATDSVGFKRQGKPDQKVCVGGFYIMKMDSAATIRWIVGTEPGAHSNDMGAFDLVGDRILFSTPLINAAGITQHSIFSNDGFRYQFQNLPSGSALVAEYDTAGSLHRFGMSNSTGTSTPKPRSITKADNKIFITGTTSPIASNGAPSLTFFNQVLPTEDKNDGFLAVLSNSLCSGVANPSVDAGPDRVSCSGGQVALGTSPITGQMYSWRSVPEGFSSNLSNPTANPNISTKYYVSVVNASGEKSVDSVMVTIDGPIASAGSDQKVCANNSVTIGMTPQTGVNYSWTSSTSGFTSSQASVTVNPTVTTTYYLEASNGGNCIGRDTVTVTKFALPSVNAGPDRLVCGPTAGATIGTSGNGQVAYSWSPGSSMSDSTLATQFVKPTNTTSYTLTVTDPVTGCSNKDTVVVTRVIVNTPVITASGNTSFCQGTSVTLTSTPTTGTYQWYYNGNPQSSETQQSTTAIHSFNIYVVVSEGGCASNASNSITTNAKPVPSAPNISGNQWLCPGSSSVLTGSGFGTFQWFLGGNLISGAAGQSYQAQQPGVYTSMVTSSNGCSSSMSAPFTVSQSAIPPTPVVSGATTICQNNGSTLLSTTTVNGSYQWLLNGNTISNANLANYTATQPGTYTVSITVNGCGASSAPHQITAGNLPTPSILGSGNLCGNDSRVLTASTSQTMGYDWYRNNQLIQTNSGKTLTVNQPGSYAVIYQQNGCYSNQSGVVSILQYPTPAAPVISQNGFMLSSSVTFGNQWYKDGVLIPGATNVQYPVSGAGVYTSVIIENGCSSLPSNSISIYPTALQSLGTNTGIRAYPNPVVDAFYVEMEDMNEIFDVTLYDASGKAVLITERHRGKAKVNCSFLASGSYFAMISLRNNQKRFVSQIMKL